MTIQVLNGPNLGRLGLREPEKSTGRRPTPSWSSWSRRPARELGVEVEVRQTDDEAELLRWLHAAADAGDPVLHQPRRPGRTPRSRCATRSPR